MTEDPIAALTRRFEEVAQMAEREESRLGDQPQVLGQRGRDQLPLQLPVRERLHGRQAPVVRAEQCAQTYAVLEPVHLLLERVPATSSSGRSPAASCARAPTPNACCTTG